MPRKQANCARGAGHLPPCATSEAMERQRDRYAERVRTQGGRPIDPAIRQRWNLAYRLSRYGMTQEDFDKLLQAQGYVCGMCRQQFREGQAICIDHDHACCQEEKRSCGKCVRGLLCLPCNTALGHIERKYDQATAYLASLSVVGDTGIEPVASSVSGRRSPAELIARDAGKVPARRR